MDSKEHEAIKDVFLKGNLNNNDFFNENTTCISMFCMAVIQGSPTLTLSNELGTIKLNSKKNPNNKGVYLFKDTLNTLFTELYQYQKRIVN